MNLKSIIIAAVCLLPIGASAQMMGRSVYNPTTGGYTYYGTPSSGMENAAAVQNFLQGMSQIQQAKQFQQQMELEREKTRMIQQDTARIRAETARLKRENDELADVLKRYMEWKMMQDSELAKDE